MTSDEIKKGMEITKEEAVKINKELAKTRRPIKKESGAIIAANGTANVAENTAKKILDKWATYIIRNNAIYEKDGVSGVDQKKGEDYTPEKYDTDIVLWIPPKNCIRIEFEDTPENNLRYIRECESAAKSIGFDYCITGHKNGKSPYFNMFNIKGLPVNQDNPLAKNLLVDLLLSDVIEKNLDRTNLGWTLSPIIQHPHWKKKYNGAIHEIIRGKNPLEHENEYPKELLKQLKRSKTYYKTDTIQIRQNYPWVEDFFINYCTEHKLPGGQRHFVIEKNLAAFIIHRKDRDEILQKYLQTQERKTNTLRTWFNTIIKGKYTQVSPGELKKYIDKNDIPYEIPSTYQKISTIEKESIVEPVYNEDTPKLLVINPDKTTEIIEDDENEINLDLWKLPKWEDLPVEDLNMIELFDDTIELVKSTLIFSKDIEYEIFVLWIFSTWKVECWDTVGFPVFIGIANSGKTRALRIIHNLAYRAPKASGIKAAAIPRLCHYYNVTLLIDEAHTKMNPKFEQGSELLNFCKDSYKRDSVYITCDNNEQNKLVVTRNFGFKAFAGEKSFNPALLTRSFVFWMDKEDPEISKLSYVEKEFEQIRSRLLNYRIKTNDPEDLGNDFELKGRNREIFESIIATGKHIGIDVSDIIEYAKKKEKKEEESLQGTPQYDILHSIKRFEENPTLDDAPYKMKTEKILEELGWITGDNKEDNKKRQSLGYILRDMGLTTKREAEGRMLFLNDEDNKNRLLQLYRRYKL